MPEELRASVRAKRICILANLASPHTIRWVNHLYRRGFEVHVVSFAESNRVLDGVHTYRLKRRIPFKLDYIRDVWQARNIVENIRPTLVHAHYGSSYGTLGRLIGFHPYVISVWGSDVYEFPRRSAFHKWLLERNLAAADYLCSTSSHMALEAQKYTSKTFLITPFGVDCGRYFPSESPAANRDEFVVGTVRSMEESYGIDTLLKAFKLFADQHTNQSCRLIIVGDGTRLVEFVNLAHTLDLDSRVQFVGKVEQQRVPDYLRSFSVFAALSRRESFGVAVLEASACGIPVVVSNVGGLPEVVVDEVTGLIVDPDDEKGAAACFEKLFLSRNLRIRLGQAGRRWVVERFDWSQTAGVMETLYDEVSSRGAAIPAGFCSASATAAKTS